MTLDQIASTVRTLSSIFKEKLDDFLHKNPEVAEAIQRKIIISERERKELSEFKNWREKEPKSFSS